MATAPLPGVEIAVNIKDLCAAVKQMAQVVPHHKISNRFIGFGSMGWCLFGTGDASYNAGTFDPLAAFTDFNAGRLLALLDSWVKDADAVIKVVVGESRIEATMPDGGRFTMPLYDVREFLRDVTPAGENTFELTEELASVVRRAAGFVSTDAHRYILTFVKVERQKGKSIAVGTDTHRLYFGEADEAPFEFFVPRWIAPLFSESQELWTDGKTNYLRLAHGIVSWLHPAGNYPNWERVLPDASSYAWDVDLSSEVAIPALKRALVYAKDNAYRVRLQPKDKTIGVSARSEEIGEIYVPFAFSTGEAKFEIAINGNYLIHALRTLGGTPQARGTDPARPFRLDRAKETVVIMPMALA